MAYNTINLRHEATFKTCIYKNVYWVPFHTLGESRYQNEELEEMNEKTPFIFGTEIHLNVYEAIQLYQMVRHFEESNDIIIKEFEQVPWQSKLFDVDHQIIGPSVQIDDFQGLDLIVQGVL